MQSLPYELWQNNKCISRLETYEEAKSNCILASFRSNKPTSIKDEEGEVLFSYIAGTLQE